MQRSLHRFLPPLLALAGLLLTATATDGQTATPSPICDEQAGFRQFDFWLGDWDVYNNADGTQAGTNRIERLNGGCLLVESWRSASGGTGTSMNYFDNITGQWRQLWVSNGTAIDIAGGLNESGEMVLIGELHNYRQGRAYDFRGTWTPSPEGHVRQFFEQKDPETGEWQVWFDGRYERQKGAGAAPRGR